MENKNKHIVTLRILLVLTYITVAFGFFAYFTTALMLPDIVLLVESDPSLVPESFKTAFDTFSRLPRGLFYVTALLYVVELVGAVLMDLQRRSGFHCYTIARLLMLLVPVLFVGREMLALGDIMFAILFITAYYLTLRSLGVFANDTENT